MRSFGVRGRLRMTTRLGGSGRPPCWMGWATGQRGLRPGKLGRSVLRPYMSLVALTARANGVLGHFGGPNWVETGAISASCGGVGWLLKFNVWRDVAIGVG